MDMIQITDEESMDECSVSVPHKVPGGKDKKRMSKDLKNAVKTKRKVASFMERQRAEMGGGGIGKYVVPRSMDDDNDNLSDEEEYLSDYYTENMEINNAGLENLTFRSKDDIDDFAEDSFENDEGLVSVPHMKDYGAGVQYRKLTCNSVLVSIEPFKKLYFVGKTLVQVVKGRIDIYGYTFGADGKKYSVFSAKGHSSLLCMMAVARNDSTHSRATESVQEQITNSGILLDELESATGALIIMEGFENEWCDGMRNCYPGFVDMIGPSLTGFGQGKQSLRKNMITKLGFEFIHNANLDKFKSMNFPPYWEQIFTDLTSQFECTTGKICPFGGKGVGKSTFVKWLTNRFICRRNGAPVLFLDLDPGQSEFSPPGMLSAHLCTEPILGPNFSHLREANRAIYLGSINVADCPVSYIKGVAELYEFCETNEQFQGIPWIVNTMGFSQGLGVHLACEIIKIIRPKCVLQLNADRDKRSFPFLLNLENVWNYKSSLRHHLPSKYRQPLEDYTFLSVKPAFGGHGVTNNNVWGPNAKTLREMVLISYFADKIGAAEGFSMRSVIPLRVPLDSIAIGTMSSKLGYNDIIRTLNGNLVALCEMSEAHFRTVDDSQKKYITDAGNYTNNCLGYGIVRAFHKQSETLYIITNVCESDILLKVNVILAAGIIGLPLNLYVNSDGSGKAQENIPYLMNRTAGTSTLHSATKKFFVQKRVTHNVLKNSLL